MERTSRIPGFYRLPVEERIAKVAAFAGLTEEEEALLRSLDGLERETADRMIENVIGALQVPMGVATNFLI
ncbi:MAG: 3-hydroxy-3-methylglutaryl-CoA reductase, partial [Candidatus Thermoplasmatota archaeon]|nr:3-hydroxy-3-methylglutaryl-CoA reductase [Candidatus Thermoplasmatota archaeon]